MQARRYITTDAPQTAGGPVAGCPGQVAAVGEQATGRAMVMDSLNTAGRQLRVQSTTASPGTTVTVNVLVDAVGDESEYAFIVNYQAPLSNPVVGGGTAGSFLRDCNVMSTGQVKCSVGGFPTNNPTSANNGIGEIGVGDNQLLITITFTVAANAAAGSTTLNFSNVNASTDAPVLVFPTPTDGTVTIAGPTTPKSRKRIRFI